MNAITKPDPLPNWTWTLYPIAPGHPPEPGTGAHTPLTAELVASKLEAGATKYIGVSAGMAWSAYCAEGNGTRRLGLRADMDALPMQEKNRFAHASQIEGRMHACGHDGHTAILLAAAWRIAQSSDFNGTLNLIFQPDEEGLGWSQGHDGRRPFPPVFP